MKTTLPAILFICALIGLTGMSTAKAETPESKRFSALCVVRDRIVVKEESVIIKHIHPDNRFLTLQTVDGREIITESKCTFVQRKESDRVSMGLTDSSQLPKDGEQRYAIWH